MLDFNHNWNGLTESGQSCGIVQRADCSHSTRTHLQEVVNGCFS